MDCGSASLEQRSAAAAAASPVGAAAPSERTAKRTAAAAAAASSAAADDPPQKLLHVRAAARFMQGRRPQQEDRHVLLDNAALLLDGADRVAFQALQCHPTAVIALFDGHCGSTCSDFCATVLPERAVSYLVKALPKSKSKQLAAAAAAAQPPAAASSSPSPSLSLSAASSSLPPSQPSGGASAEETGPAPTAAAASSSTAPAATQTATTGPATAASPGSAVSSSASAAATGSFACSTAAAAAPLLVRLPVTPPGPVPAFPGMNKELQQLFPSIGARLASAFRHTDRDFISKYRAMKVGGCTAVLLLVLGAVALVASVGDSRAVAGVLLQKKKKQPSSKKRRCEVAAETRGCSPPAAAAACNAGGRRTEETSAEDAPCSRSNSNDHAEAAAAERRSETAGSRDTAAKREGETAASGLGAALRNGEEQAARNAASDTAGGGTAAAGLSRENSSAARVSCPGCFSGEEACTAGRGGAAAAAGGQEGEGGEEDAPADQEGKEREGEQDEEEGQWKALRVTRDHKPDDPEEKERIEKNGGLVLRVGGVARVAPKDYEDRAKRHKREQCLHGSATQPPPVLLAVSRGLGDRELKEERLLTATPDVTALRLTGEIRMLVVACDGVWDVMSDEEVVAIASQHLHDPQEAASQVVKRAFQLGSQDNLTSIVVVFDYEGE